MTAEKQTVAWCLLGLVYGLAFILFGIYASKPIAEFRKSRGWDSLSPGAYKFIGIFNGIICIALAIGGLIHLLTH